MPYKKRPSSNFAYDLINPIKRSSNRPFVREITDVFRCVSEVFEVDIQDIKRKTCHAKVNGDEPTLKHLQNGRRKSTFLLFYIFSFFLLYSHEVVIVVTKEDDDV